MTAPTVGVQLYTVRDACRADFLGTLRRVRELGYPAVEGFWGLFGAEPAAVRRELDTLGLALPSAHVDLETLEQRLGEAVDLWGGLGCGTLVCPWVNEATRRGPDAWERLGDRLDRIGERLHAQGLRFAYHNHDFELAGGDDGLARILARAAPEHLALELDVFWIEHAGRDPAAYLGEIGERVRLVHLKDGRHRPLAFTPLGEGEVDLAAAIDAARAAGVGALYVEQDECDGDPFEALRRSAAALFGMGLL
ncbi:MAG TPA: sugar phosphate isomerase/epimerase [Thermoanaerobaculia bacterium]|nr:sugar phosphate isomerase/epimerase [Thermoanaerobaculia bacterium]